jgi:glycosyltransferase involved in cell wall biosynthesis
MKLSVLMITYNHERFIRQALDSALMQDVDFDFEIVVGEDLSTDGTRSILLEYAQKYPGKVRLSLREKNMGAVTNFYTTLTECRGEYVALLEGDDFWTDPQKLRRQVAFLDEHRDYVSCFHNVNGRFEDRSRPDYSYVRGDQTEKDTYVLEDLLKVNVIPTCSCVFRRGLFDPIPTWAFGLKMGDYPLHLLNAQYGKTGYLDLNMAVYRVHSGGVWTGMNAMTQLLVDLKLFECLATGLKPRFRAAARHALSLREWNLGNAYARSGERTLARRYVLRSIKNSPMSSRPRLRTKLKVLARVSMPALFGEFDKERRNAVRTESAARPTGPAIPGPRVSVIIPVFNGERYLVEAVQSTLRQTYADFECLIIDDGSTDRTPSILYELSLRDTRVRPIRIAHGGIVEALNAGLQEARGELIARMDADDICHPDRLEKQVRYLDEHPDCVVVGSKVMLVDPLNSTLWEIPVKHDHDGIETELLRGNGWAIFHPTAVIRKQAILDVGGYRVEYQWSEDLDLFLRLGEIGRLANLQEPLLRYRQHFSSVNKIKMEIQKRRSEQLLIEAYRRRGLQPPARFEIDLGPNLSRYNQVLAWGNHALVSRNLPAARRHALTALRYQPLRRDSWSLVYHSLAGR